MHRLLSLIDKIPFISLARLFIFPPLLVLPAFGFDLPFYGGRYFLKSRLFGLFFFFVFLGFPPPPIVHLCESEGGREGGVAAAAAAEGSVGGEACVRVRERARLLQLESIFALGISITGLQSSASLIMDGHMALLTHTVLRLALPPAVLLLPITGLSFVLNFCTICFRNSAGFSFPLFFFFPFCLFIYFIFFTFGRHTLFFYDERAPALPVSHESLEMTHHAEL